MFRIIESFNNLPCTFKVCKDANFQPGNLASLTMRSGEPHVEVSDGLHPIGILDDIKSEMIRGVVWDEQHIVSVTGEPIDGVVVSDRDHRIELKHPRIIAKSFVSSINGTLDSEDGVFTIPKGTSANSNGDLTNKLGKPYLDGSNRHLGGRTMSMLSFKVSYAYNMRGKLADDSTMGSGMATVWARHMIAETDMFDTTQQYRKYSNLYVEKGLFTTRKQDMMCPCIGFVMESPTYQHPILRVFFDPHRRIESGMGGYL